MSRLSVSVAQLLKEREQMSKTLLKTGRELATSPLTADECSLE